MQDEDYHKLILVNGEVCLVSIEDAHWLTQRRWYRDAHGYAVCDLFGGRAGKSVLMHRLILMAPDTSTVDHANGDKLDNRRSNLRLATQSQQNANRPKIKGLSRFKGVHRRHDGLKWVAQGKDPGTGRKLHLGSFVSEEDAARAYDAHARARFGSFACLNFPQVGERGAVMADEQPECRSHRPE